MNKIDELSISDLKILAELPKMTSIRSFAQNLDITPSYLSKKIKHIENCLGHQLIIRSSQGIKTTTIANPLVKTARQILDKLNEFQDLSNGNVQRDQIQVIRFGTRGFLNSALIPILIVNQDQDSRYRFIDMSPNDQLIAAKNNEIDVLLTLKEVKFGESWIEKRIGRISWSVYARKGHPLASKKVVTLEQAQVYHFTKPTYWDGSSIVTIEDSIPTKKGIIKYGHGVQNTQSAIAVVASSNHLTYIPDVAAKHSLELGELVKVEVSEIKHNYDQLYLYVHQDRINNSTFKEISEKVESYTL